MSKSPPPAKFDEEVIYHGTSTDTMYQSTLTQIYQNNNGGDDDEVVVTPPASKRAEKNKDDTRGKVQGRGTCRSIKELDRRIFLLRI